MKIAKSTWIALVLFVFGALTAHSVLRSLSVLPTLQNYISNTLVLANYRRYDAFNPALKFRKYGFISSSFYAQTGVYNKENGDVIRSPHGYIGRIANFILGKEYDTEIRFYDGGRSGTSSQNHIWFMSQLATAPGLEGILYTNGYTSIDTPYKKGGRRFDNYVTVETLKELETRYPQLSKQTDLLYEFIKKRVKMDISVASYYTDSNNKLYYDCDDQFPKSAFRTTDCQALRHFAKFRDNIGSKLLGWFQGEDETKQFNELTELFSAALAEYGKAEQDKPNIVNQANIRSDYKAAEKKYEEAFYDLIVGISEAENLKLIFYFPPMYELPPNEYWQKLKPFIDRLRERYKDKEQVYFIDNTFLKGINSFDAYFRNRKICKKELCKKAHNVGIIGNVKRIRALLSEMQKLNLIEAPVKPVGTAFSNESNIPEIEMCLRIIGVNIGARSDCIFKAEDYLENSIAAKKSLKELYPDAKSTNEYINRYFFK